MILLWNYDESYKFIIIIIISITTIRFLCLSRRFSQHLFQVFTRRSLRNKCLIDRFRLFITYDITKFLVSLTETMLFDVVVIIIIIINQYFLLPTEEKKKIFFIRPWIAYVLIVVRDSPFIFKWLPLKLSMLIIIFCNVLL